MATKKQLEAKVKKAEKAHKAAEAKARTVLRTENAIEKKLDKKIGALEKLREKSNDRHDATADKVDDAERALHEAQRALEDFLANEPGGDASE